MGITWIDNLDLVSPICIRDGKWDILGDIVQRYKLDDWQFFVKNDPYNSSDFIAKQIRAIYRKFASRPGDRIWNIKGKTSQKWTIGC